MKILPENNSAALEIRRVRYRQAWRNWIRDPTEAMQPHRMWVSVQTWYSIWWMGRIEWVIVGERENWYLITLPSVYLVSQQWRDTASEWVSMWHEHKIDVDLRNILQLTGIMMFVKNGMFKTMAVWGGRKKMNRASVIWSPSCHISICKGGSSSFYHSVT